MKAPANLIVSIVSIVSLAALSAPPAPGAEPPFSLTISVPQTTVKAGSEVRVKVVLRNTSGREIGVPDEEPSGPGQYGFGVEARDGQGAPAHLTEFARAGRFSARSEGSYYMPTVRPGKNLEFEISISRLYDLSKPGRYTIQVRRGHDGESGAVSSNTITVIVEP